MKRFDTAAKVNEVAGPNHTLVSGKVAGIARDVSQLDFDSDIKDMKVYKVRLTRAHMMFRTQTHVIFCHFICERSHQFDQWFSESDELELVDDV